MVFYLKKAYLWIAVAVIAVLGIIGFFYYREINKTYLPFFLKSNVYVQTYGFQSNYWMSYYFQPITQGIEENSDGVVLKIKYKNPENKWINAKVLLLSKDDAKYKVNNIKVLQTVNGMATNLPTAPIIKNKQDAINMIPKGKQILIFFWGDYPNLDQRTAENCKTAQTDSNIDLCSISDVVDNLSNNQLYFGETEDMKGQYMIPNFIVIQAINEN